VAASKKVAACARAASHSGAASLTGKDPTQETNRRHAATASAPPYSITSSARASRVEVLRDLWTRSGLDEVETREITVQRTFPDFEDFWTISLSAPSMRFVVAATAPNDIELLKARVRARLPADATGRITYSARANAVKGRVQN
jgi:hypothetical protein